LTTAAVLALGGVAHADNIQDTIEDTGTGVTLVAGSGISGTASIRLNDNSSGGDKDAGCNIDSGDDPLVLTVVTPSGVTATPNPLKITSCNKDGFPVTFTASSSAVSGPVTVIIDSVPAGGGTFFNQVYIPITVTQPVPTNTKPSVAVTGVTDGDSYEIGTVPTATCTVTDAEDGGSTFNAVLSGTLPHGLGTQTATCDYTDTGHLAADTASATYTIVDTGDPTISHTLSPNAANANGWYKQDVTVSFDCADSGSDIQSCVGDTTLGEGADQSVTGTATDWAGNTATDVVTGISIDKTAPTVGFSGGPGSSYYFGDDPAAPTCVGSDALSGLASCAITGGGTSLGAHSYTATATDKAGNTATATLNYEVLKWSLSGFYSPVDMGGVWNTVKGGSTVPLKFEAFAGSELTSTTAVKSFTQKQVTCLSGVAIDEVEITSTGGTTLRYDTTGGQFIQNWATPKKPGTCWTVTMTTADSSSVSANFMLK
jgi:hypothetical protein